MPTPQKTNFAYFGSSSFSIYVLEELERAGFIPSLIITTPDKPAGRKLVLTPTLVKTWAKQKGIPVLDPTKLDADFVSTLKKATTTAKIDLFIVASYGKIIPQAILDIPAHKTLNVHPSLLPKYRGASPVQSAILDDEKNTGVTIMRIDAEMDHGPILAQKNVTVGEGSVAVAPEWPADERMKEIMGHEGGKLLAQTIEPWVAGKIPEIEQNHSLATFTKKIHKEDAEIRLTDITEKPYETFRKIQAYHGWPSAFYFDENKKRVKITRASYNKTTNTLKIEKIIQEGKPEQNYSSTLPK